MSNQNGISGGQLMLAFIAGAVTGAAVALLASPQSGPQVRESLKDWATDAQGRARVPDTLRSAYNRASRAAKSAFHKELELEREGEVEMPSEVPTHES